MEVYQHVLKKAMNIHNEDEIESFLKWMTHISYENFTDLHVDFYCIVDVIQDYCDNRVDGSKYALKVGTMNKLRLFIS